MPKFVGNTIPGAQIVFDSDLGKDHVRLTYSQACRLPPQTIACVLDTSDCGSRGRFAKRWYRWYARAKDIVASERSTKQMIIRVATRTGAHITDTLGVTHAITGCGQAIGQISVTTLPINCMTCLVIEARGGMNALGHREVRRQEQGTRLQRR